MKVHLWGELGFYGPRRRSRFDVDQSWWQRIEIVEDRKADRLRFVVTGDRARAEENLAAGQLRMADSFIAQACASPASDGEVVDGSVREEK